MEGINGIYPRNQVKSSLHAYTIQTNVKPLILKPKIGPTNIYFFVVCLDITLTTRYDGNLLKWELGFCSSTMNYEDYGQYVQRCCLIPGYYTLSCYNTEKPDGWKKGYLEFHRRQYCNDFMSYKAMQRVQVTGMVIGFKL